MSELNYTEETRVVKNYLGTEEELQAAIIAGEVINNFQGGFEVFASKLDELVPYSFLGLTKEDPDTKESIYIDKTWGEYTRFHESINEGKILIEPVGGTPLPENRCCMGPITSEELYKWIAELGVENIHTRSKFWNLRKLPEENI